MCYMNGESIHKTHPEYIHHVYSQFLPDGMDAAGICSMIKFSCMSHPNIRNDTIRFEISPAREHTADFTLEDWCNLWKDFTAEFDKQTFYDKNGKLISGQTNIQGSIGVVWLHEESKSGIPHLHAGISRVDMLGNINNDHYIHLRAQRAAEAVARKRGWATTLEVREENKALVVGECLEVLSEMSRWSWDDYFARLTARGFQVIPRRDKENKVRGYTLLLGCTKYKASELGSGRKLTAANIEGTWRDLHLRGQTAQHNHRDISAHVEPSFVSAEHYKSPRPVCSEVEFDYGNYTYTRYVPDKVIDYISEKFSSAEIINGDKLTDLALAFFTDLIPMEAQTTSGGGSSANDRGWGDDDDEDLQYAYRCAKAAINKIGIRKTPRKQGR